MELRSRRGTAGAIAAITLFACALGAAPARAAVPHVVQPGETLWGIASAHNFTTATVATFNGLSAEAHVIAGSTLEIPTEAEGAAALAEAEPAPAPSSGADAPAPAPASAYGLATVWSPSGEVPLDPAAAGSWNAMREHALSSYGVDLYPGGLLSGYRTHEQQAYLYDLFLTGQGAPANVPGSSSHEIGVAIDLAAPEMRSVIDEIGPAHGWYAPHANEWWHVEYWG